MKEEIKDGEVPKEPGVLHKRKTEAVLNMALEKQSYDTHEEKSIIEMTLQGKNSDLVEIVKDDNLRKIWTCYFFKKSAMTKSLVMKIDIDRAVEKIKQLKNIIASKNIAVLLLSLGQILLK